MPLRADAVFPARPVPLSHPTRLVRADRSAPVPKTLAKDRSPGDFLHQTYVRRARLGDILVDMGALSERDLARALLLQQRHSGRLGDVLVRRDLLPETTLVQALARQRGIGVADPAAKGCLAADILARRIPLQTALTHRIVPWKKVGCVTIIATARPEAIDDLADAVPPDLRPCLFAAVTDSALDARLQTVHGAQMARAAECRVPEDMSCRLWRTGRGQAPIMPFLVMALLLAALIWPAMALRIATAAAVLVMWMNLSLRVAAAYALRIAPGAFASVRASQDAMRALPCVSILVPLNREPDIAGPLTERLSRLNYPREHLDICLVVEADDAATLDALAQASLPPWMRIIVVPDGQPRTKPRAMNYALNFTRGEIIGIYDAEDAPAPEQLLTVASRFQTAPPEVACLQGLLDYYNPTRNWMSRCFTIEYANWFRLVLPGIARMGLVVPLGGTTLFFRRDALNLVGGWDAHNVTEDADLGVRLARMGYRTEIIQTTTLEEANANPLAWVKQRSRWMKGYVLTWAVHSRAPVRLWRELGARRFFGFHLLFLGSILNALLMPTLWSTVVMLFGIHHPIADWLPGSSVWVWGILMFAATAIAFAVAWIGCRTAHHRKLRRWIPTMELYFPLATLAVFKALVEVVFKPFHWDKTAHGAFGGTGTADISELETTLRQVDATHVLRAKAP